MFAHNAGVRGDQKVASPDDIYSAPQEETENHFFQHSVRLFCDGTW